MSDGELHRRLEAAQWTSRALPGFIGAAGPLWTRREGVGWAYGLLATAAHLNPARVVHGGALMTLLDHAISTVAWEASGRLPCVTVQFDAHFLAAVREGEFVEARAGVSQRGNSLVFMHGRLSVEGRPVLQAQAVLKVLAAAAQGTIAG